MPDHRLRKLDLSGFKTFARRTELLLPAGLTGIVGPNGSGKSNLADALRWALGEQSLQHIRSKKTEDVIFAGGANRPPLGMAEVTLTLDNTSGWVPLDFSEVTLTRRAHRSGDNEYFINSARVRLRDIIELRNKAGFGQSSYSVIGQGLVDAVLSQRPEERRALFEEAAGIRHYQAKRDQTLDQLAAAQQNLLRVQDILTEIEPRLESLRRQSERARQHAELEDELRKLQIRWYAARHRQLQHQLSEASSAAGGAQRELESVREETVRLEAQAASLETERLAAEERLTREQRASAELQRRREQLHGQIELTKDKLAFIQQQNANAQSELSEFSSSQAVLLQQRQQAEATIVELAAAEAKLATDMEQARQYTQAQVSAVQETERRLVQSRDALTQADSARSQQERELADIAERLRTLKQQGEQHAEDLRRKDGLAQVLTEKKEKLQVELLQMRGEEERLSGQTEEARMAASAASTDLQQKEVRLGDLRRSHDELRTRLSLLRELQTNLEGLAEGTRVLLNSDAPGVLRSVAQGLKVQPGYERAIAAALGHKLDAVLVDDDATALNILQSGEITEATLLIQQATATIGAEAHPIQHARPATSVLEDADPAVRRLLANAYIVTELRRALEAKAVDARFVTIDGDLVDVDGSITRRNMSAGEAVLKRQKALEELEERVRASGAALEASETDREETATRSVALAEQLQKFEAESRRLVAERQQKSAELRNFVQQIETAQAQLDWLANLKQQVEQQARSLDLRRTGILAEADQRTASITGLQQAVRAAEAELASIKQAEQLEGERLGQLRLELGVTRQQRQHLDAQLKELAQQFASAERQLEMRQQRVDDQAAIALQLEREMSTASSDLAGVEAEWAHREQELPPLRQRCSMLVEELRQVREKEITLHEQESELDKRCYRLTFEQQRKAEELETLAGSLIEDLHLTLDLLPQPADDQPEPSRRDVDTLKSRLLALGPINPGALEEFEEVAQRHEFLTTQKADLEGAAAQLQKVIAELEELTEREFLQTFERVSTEFERFFQLMFEGGKVEMFLTNPDSVNTTGIEILAQPPGKRLQALALLSGGERALVASALLFAILAVKPVPFCLLDEVDAALDEANVKRFCQALKSLSEKTQFVVITHNRETMAVADALYGVSMNQDGISRLVSLRLPRDAWQESEERAETDQEVRLAAS